MSRIVVVGCGAAGMMAAITAAEGGHRVTVLERNDRPGKKILITGGGRCNVTNTAGPEEMLRAAVGGGKFLHSAMAGFTGRDMRSMLRKLGLETKVESNGRVFPVTDRAQDVVDVLWRRMKELGVDVRLACRVAGLIVVDGSGNGIGDPGSDSDFTVGSKKRDDNGNDGGVAEKQCRTDAKKDAVAEKTVEVGHERVKTPDGGSKVCRGVILENGKEISADTVIVTTGGMTFKDTGSTGDGIRFAREHGLKITEPVPGLVPLTTEDEWVKELSGISVSDADVMIRAGKKQVYRDRGDILFAHFGVTGPVVLNGSSAAGAKLRKAFERGESVELIINAVGSDADDRSPGSVKTKSMHEVNSPEDFEQVLQDEADNHPAKEIRNVLSGYVPRALTDVILRLSDVPEGRKCADLKKAERRKIAENCCRLSIGITGTRKMNYGMITRGGVSLKEIDPKTMESKKIKGLRFAGEVLDADALTGGYNLHIAWATGRAAGKA